MSPCAVTAHIPAADIFSDYAYFSSYSDSWVAHARAFVESAVNQLNLESGIFFVEVASNDGYLLQHSVAMGIRSLGIEPAANIAEVARIRTWPQRSCFLGNRRG